MPFGRQTGSQHSNQGWLRILYDRLRDVRYIRTFLSGTRRHRCTKGRWRSLNSMNGPRSEASIFDEGRSLTGRMHLHCSSSCKEESGQTDVELAVPERMYREYRQ